MSGIQGPDHGKIRNGLYLASLNGVVKNGSSITVLPQTPFTSSPRRQLTRAAGDSATCVRCCCSASRQGFNASQRSAASISLPRGGSQCALLVICPSARNYRFPLLSQKPRSQTGSTTSHRIIKGPA